MVKKKDIAIKADSQRTSMTGSTIVTEKVLNKGWHAAECNCRDDITDQVLSYWNEEQKKFEYLNIQIKSEAGPFGKLRNYWAWFLSRKDGRACTHYYNNGIDYMVYTWNGDDTVIVIPVEEARSQAKEQETVLNCINIPKSQLGKYINNFPDGNPKGKEGINEYLNLLDNTNIKLPSDRISALQRVQRYILSKGWYMYNITDCTFILRYRGEIRKPNMKMVMIHEFDDNNQIHIDGLYCEWIVAVKNLYNTDEVLRFYDIKKYKNKGYIHIDDNDFFSLTESNPLQSSKDLANIDIDYLSEEGALRPVDHPNKPLPLNEDKKNKKEVKEKTGLEFFMEE